MMELKVQCDCGQKYKFDVEPVNNQMPFRVNCPICNADGTAKANALLQAQAPAPAAPIPMAAPAPIAPMAAPPPVPMGVPKLRIGGSAPAPAAAGVADAPPPPLAPIAPARPGAFPGRPGAAPAAANAKPKRKPNFALGMVGGLLGALVGAFIYYLIFKLTGWRIGIVGIAVGFLAGLGARLLGGEQEGNELGYITAALAVAGILGAQYCVARSWWNEAKNDRPASGYEAEVTEAKKIVAAIPNGTDQEIRMYMAKEEADEGDKPDPAAVPADLVKEFQGKLPEWRDLASGKITKEDYDKQHAAEIAKAQEEDKSEEGTFNAVFVLLLLNRVTIVSTIAAAGLAFKMSS
jgi:hypothetical protein